MTTGVISSALFAAAATLFYKKNLRKDGLVIVVGLVIMGLYTELSENIGIIKIVLISAFLATVLTLHTDMLWLKSAMKMSLFLAFFVAILDVKFSIIECIINLWLKSNDDRSLKPLWERNLSSTVRHGYYAGGIEEYGDNTSTQTDGSSVGHLAYCRNMFLNNGGHLVYKSAAAGPSLWWMKARIIMIALPQFARKPTWLKAKLQQTRSHLGPIYVLYVATYAARMYMINHGAWTQQGLWMCIAIAAIFAGVFTRPDNSTMCDIVRFPSSRSCRKLCHRYLMISTFIFCLVFFTLDPTIVV